MQASPVMPTSDLAAVAAVASPPAEAGLDALMANRRAFVSYVERRVGDRALAEELVQDAFVRGLDRGGELRDPVVGWFYRVLHNAAVDHLRRRAVANRRLERFAAELATREGDAAEAVRVACGCVATLAGTLKAEYADALRSIEIDGMPVKDYAAARGISASNAGVRIFRAREALRRQVARACGTCAAHGCADCSCGATPTGA